VGGRLGKATVVDVAETRVHLDNEGRREYLDLLPADSRPASLGPRSDGLGALLDSGIRKLNEQSYEIQRGTLESILANTPALMQEARIVPELREGRSAGFRLYAVRAEGTFARLGLRNGDVIVAVNGLSLTSPESGLEAFLKLRSASHVSLAFEREGRRLTTDYRIR
jgi:general secretion pathway protein C